MKGKKIVLGALVTGISFTFALLLFFSLPANSLTVDINPSIEITTNRLDKVISVEPLNKDAEDLLDNFTLKDKDLDSVVNDLVDLMILTGHISGGNDNLVMISVDDDNADSALLTKVNQLIAAYLDNKQVEATLLSQSIPVNSENRELASENAISPGKLELIKKIMAREESLSLEQLKSISLREILLTAEELNIKPDELFEHIINDIAACSQGNAGDETTEPVSLIGRDKAMEIALELTEGGKVVEFELDKDDGRYEYEIEIKWDGREYEIEIDAHTGKVLKFEEDDDDDDRNDNTNQLIGRDKAIETALGLTGGGKVVEIELDKDDGRYEYEIEIKWDGREYEIEIDAHTGKVLEFDDDDDDDYDDRNDNTSQLIGRDKAIEIALGLTGGGKVVEFELDKDDGRYEYEIEIKWDGREYEIEIDAHTGKVLEFDDDDDDEDRNVNVSQLIGRDKAIEIALGLTGGGKVVEFELDEDDGRYEYEIEIEKDGREYEIEIDAHTGKVLEFEEDD